MWLNGDSSWIYDRALIHINDAHLSFKKKLSFPPFPRTITVLRAKTKCHKKLRKGKRKIQPSILVQFGPTNELKIGPNIMSVKYKQTNYANKHH